MLRVRAISDAKAAAAYYQKSDGGLELEGLRKEVGGEGVKLLGITGVDFAQFERLLNGLDPFTGNQLTALLVPGRIPGWDFTASIPKGVTIAMEAGDDRVHDALWDAGRETMRDLEAMIKTRVRKSGEIDDRLTGNLLYHAFEHPETRPAKADGLPDMDRHIHFVISNVTFDPVEKQWKAIKIRDVFELRKYFDRVFDMRLSHKLTQLGYDIDQKYKPDPRGGQKYHTWDIAMPKSVVDKFSRRTAEVEKLAADLGVASSVGKDRLGATSRLHKRQDMTLADYRKYWKARITPDEAKKIASVIEKAKRTRHTPDPSKLTEAVEYAVAHEFYRNSVVPWHQLAITAMERCMGHASPEQVEPEARRQGVLFVKGEVTTREVLAQEGRIVRFAREGRGTMRPLAEHQGFAVGGDGKRPLGAGSRLGESPNNTRNTAGMLTQIATLSTEQQALSRHVLTSKDRVILLRGAAGTGKTHTMKATIARIDRPVAVLAPSASASRGLLRDDFPDANTVAMFLHSEKMQSAVKGGIIWVDEAALMPIDDLERLCAVAEQQDARLILQGDPKQHRAVARDGNMFHVLRQYAGLPMAELKDIRRQSGEYKDAVAAIEKGDVLKGHAIIESLGWVKQTGKDELEKAVADECYGYLQKKESFIVVGITHAQNDDITEELRKRLRAEGKIGKEEITVTSLRPQGLTDAEKGDLARLQGVIQFHQNSPGFLRGQRQTADELRAAKTPPNPKHYAVYTPGELRLSKGDLVRVTAGGTDVTGRRLDNGQKFTFEGLDDKGNIALSGGKSRYVVKSTFGHLAWGYVDTSYKSQGQTRARTVGVFTEKNLRGINAEQYYVTASRATKSAKLFTTLPPETLREEIQKADARKSATELLEPVKQPKMREKFLKMMARRVREKYKSLRERVETAITRTNERGWEREQGYGR